MGTPIAGKTHTTPLVGTEKVALSPDGWATTQEVAALGGGGGGGLPITETDNAGNVYTIEFDPNNFGLGLECAGVDGSTTYMAVAQGSVGFSCVGPDGANMALSFNLNGYAINAIGPGGSPTSVVNGDIAGTASMTVFDGVTTKSVAVSLADGIQLNGVTVDPTLPWPGG